MNSAAALFTTGNYDCGSTTNRDTASASWWIAAPVPSALSRGWWSGVMPAPWLDGPAGWQPREWLIPSKTELCLYTGQKSIAAKERLLQKVPQLSNGEFEEKDIKIINSRSECRKN
jgi:hypothetical protein